MHALYIYILVLSFYDAILSFGYEKLTDSMPCKGFLISPYCLSVSLQMFASMMKPAFLFDGRNFLDHKKMRQIGFIVYGLGTPLDPFLQSSGYR
jgi:hypothetical protein